MLVKDKNKDKVINPLATGLAGGKAIKTSGALTLTKYNALVLVLSHL